MDNILHFFFFEWLAEVRVWSLQLVSFLVGLRTYQHPSINNSTYLISCKVIMWRYRITARLDLFLLKNNTF